jgi:hypothetical protein
LIVSSTRNLAGLLSRGSGDAVARIIGLVLYWAAILIAVAAGVGAIVVALVGDGDRFLIAGLLCTFGAIVWLIGFACRRALSGSERLAKLP